MRAQHFTFAAASDPCSLKSSNFITSAIMKPFSKSVWIFPAAWGAFVPFYKNIRKTQKDDLWDHFSLNCCHSKKAVVILIKIKGVNKQHISHQLTKIVQAFTSSFPAVKKYCSWRALNPVVIILARALVQTQCKQIHWLTAEYETK